MTLNLEKAIEERETLRQPFELDYTSEFKLAQPIYVDEFLRPWVESLPNVSLPILEIGAGSGQDMAVLEGEGHVVISSDISLVMLRKNIAGFRVQMSAEMLALASGSLKGVVIKDAWVFFPPELRRATLNELKRVLIPGGKVLISSQAEPRLIVHYIPDGSAYPQKESLDDDSEWQRDVARIASDANVFSIEYITTTANLAQLAQAADLDMKVLAEYDFRHPLAQENRWVSRHGFIAELTNS